MTSPKRTDLAADRHGVTIRDKLVMLGLAPADGPINYETAFHVSLDLLLANRAIRPITHPIRTTP